MVGRGEDIEDKEILRTFAEGDEPIYGTAELANKFDFSKSGIRRRLYNLERKGYLGSKKIGNSPAFWITDEGIDRLDELEG